MVLTLCSIHGLNSFLHVISSHTHVIGWFLCILLSTLSLTAQALPSTIPNHLPTVYPSLSLYSSCILHPVKLKSEVSVCAGAVIPLKSCTGLRSQAGFSLNLIIHYNMQALVISMVANCITYSYFLVFLSLIIHVQTASWTRTNSADCR